MYKPVSLLGNLFKSYLLLPTHPAKIRMERFFGKLFFSSGIMIRNKDGISFKLDPNDWITRTMLEEGDYEAGSVKLGRTLVNKGSVFIDIGANFGLYTCQLGFKNQQIQILAIEPNYKILGRLKDNAALNQLDNKLDIINAAASDKFQLVYLQLPAQDNLGSTTVSLTSTGGIAVLSCSLQYLLESKSISKVTLIKIDIEGNEFSVFVDFPFEKIKIENIILEFNFLSKIKFEQLRIFFDSKGFDFFTIFGERLMDENVGIPENNIWIVNRESW